MLRIPPAADRVEVVLTAATLGNLLVLCPSAATAEGMAARLERAGLPVARHPRDWARGLAGTTVVGTRAAAWAPVGDLAGIVVLDEHDEAHQQEQAPTWHARDVALERASRAGIPCLLTSPCPTLEARTLPVLAPDRAIERAGWPAVDVIDRREEDPYRAGLFSPALVRLLRTDQRVLCVLNRTGRSRLLACAACGSLASCEACGAAVAQPDEDLVCLRCATRRPPMCLSCDGLRLRNVRAGVARVREELEALVGEPVAELTAASDGATDTRVVVGTEAVLQRVERADAVVFLDLDQELLAPRYRAAEQALALVARAARVAARSGPQGSGRPVGSCCRRGCPTTRSSPPLCTATPSGWPMPSGPRREQLGFPPFAALAAVSGEAAPAFVKALGRPVGVDVAEVAGGRWLLRAADHTALCDVLATVKRPPGRLRVEVDPLRV